MSNAPTVARWNVRIVRCGEHYGKDNCLTYGDGKYDQKLDDNGARRCDVDPMVEFYDVTVRPDIWGDKGYFYGRYYLSTLIKNAEKYISGDVRFCLHGGGTYDPAVYIEAEQTAEIWKMLISLPEVSDNENVLAINKESLNLLSSTA